MVREGAADLRAAGVPLSEGRGVFVIFNPASGRGLGARRIEAYRALLKQHLPGATLVETTRPGEEAELADRAVAEGYGVVATAGGDGTLGNVADRLVAAARPGVALGLLPSGTGNDFGRSLGLSPADPREAVQVLARGRTRRVDVGRLDTPSAAEYAPERKEARHFLNLIGFGFDVAVIDAAAHARFLTGEPLYKVTALQQLFRFAGVPVGVEGASGAVRSGEHLMLTVSNGRFFGGGFPIAPTARVDDGQLHACCIGDAPPLTRLRLFHLAERGRHVESERVEILADSGFRLTFPVPPRFEMDGDVRQSEGPVMEARVLPGALEVVAP